jgi:hypothetical protein
VHVLLAAVLLVFIEAGGMSSQNHCSGNTSNDLLESLIAKHAAPVLTYQIVAQNILDLQKIENASIISVGPHRGPAKRGPEDAFLHMEDAFLHTPSGE